MAHFYTNENFPLPAALILRRLGHDVLTTQEAGTSNQALTDAEVLRFATQQERAVLTINRKHFVKLHQSSSEHGGIIVCSFDTDFESLAERVDRAVREHRSLGGQLIRIDRPG